MQRVLADLIDLLALERLDVDLYRGRSQDLALGATFGGQVVAQALSAAAQTVAAGRPAHMLHGLFLRAGDAQRPILYQVDRLRDGKSFSTRRVSAVQEGGEALFSLEASFQVPEEGFEHQDPMPAAPPPDALPPERELAMEVAKGLPEPLRTVALADQPIEFRSVEARNPLQPRVSEPRRRIWCRAVDRLPDDPALQRCLLAYASDFAFLGTSLDAHGASWATGVRLVTLDHVMWFHRPFRCDDWLLYAVESPSASGGRALVRGQFFDRTGRLVASSAQEGLIRRLG